MSASSLKDIWTPIYPSPAWLISEAAVPLPPFSFSPPPHHPLLPLPPFSYHSHDTSTPIPLVGTHQHRTQGAQVGRLGWTHQPSVWSFKTALLLNRLLLLGGCIYPPARPLPQHKPLWLGDCVISCTTFRKQTNFCCGEVHLFSWASSLFARGMLKL